MRSSLAVVVFFIVKSESKRSPGTDFAAEDVKEIFVPSLQCIHYSKPVMFILFICCSDPDCSAENVTRL